MQAPKSRSYKYQGRSQSEAPSTTPPGLSGLTISRDINGLVPFTRCTRTYHLLARARWPLIFNSSERLWSNSLLY